MTVTPPVHVLPPPRPLRTDPITALTEALDQLASLDTSIYTSKAELRLTAYHDALCSLANTGSDSTRKYYQPNTERLPTGTLVKDATPEELRLMTLAFHGIARDRLTPGMKPRDLYTWLEMADDAIHLYKQRRAA